MHYPPARGDLVDFNRQQEPLENRIRYKIVPEVPDDSWYEYENELPLQHATDTWTIALVCMPFCTAQPRTDAVYVLECLPNSGYRQSTAMHFGRANKPWNGRVEGKNRLLYVGMTKNVLRRLNDHLNSAGDKGAHFTAVFPPVRVLHISW